MKNFRLKCEFVLFFGALLATSVSCVTDCYSQSPETLKAQQNLKQVQQAQPGFSLVNSDAIKNWEQLELRFEVTNDFKTMRVMKGEECLFDKHLDDGFWGPFLTNQTGTRFFAVSNRGSLDSYNLVGITAIQFDQGELKSEQLKTSESHARYGQLTVDSLLKSNPNGTKLLVLAATQVVQDGWEHTVRIPLTLDVGDGKLGSFVFE